MNLKLIIILCVFMGMKSYVVYAQEDAIQSVEQPKKKKDGKWKFIFNFDTRNSFINKQPVKFNGIKLGMGNKKNRVGIGVHNTRKPVLEISESERPDATDTNLYKFRYSSFFYERVLIHTKRWELSAPIHLNFGELEGFYRDTLRKNIQFLEQNVNSVTLSFKAHFKVFRWIGFGSGVGYNLLTSGNRRAKRALSAPFYSFGVKLFLGEAWKLMFKKGYRKTEWVE